MEMVSGASPASCEGSMSEGSMRLSMARSYGTFAGAVERRTRLFMHMLVLMAALMTAGPVFAQPVKMVVLGDSLSAGLGLSGPAAFPARLQKALKDKGVDVDMINAGVSGDTSSGGRDRLDWSVPEGTEAVILELGAHDAPRGTGPNITPSPLTHIPTPLKARKIAVLPGGMLRPPKYGSVYAARFH